MGNGPIGPVVAQRRGERVGKIVAERGIDWRWFCGPSGTGVSATLMFRYFRSEHRPPPGFWDKIAEVLEIEWDDLEDLPAKPYIEQVLESVMKSNEVRDLFGRYRTQGYLVASKPHKVTGFKGVWVHEVGCFGDDAVWLISSLAYCEREFLNELRIILDEAY